MPGLGDAIYCRPFVRAFATQIESEWPALFSDLKLDGMAGPRVSPRYDSKNLAFGNILQAIGRFFPEPDPFIFDLPDFQKPGLTGYAVVRSPSLRRDFYAPARNPKSEYIRYSARLLKQAGYITVGVGNIRDGERFDGEPPETDHACLAGELTIPELMGLIAHASLIVAGPGWTVPASLAYRVPHVIVYGGAGKWNQLKKLVDPRIGPSFLATVEPDCFCMRCPSVVHDCDKKITGFDGKFLDAIDRAVSLRRQAIC